MTFDGGTAFPRTEAVQVLHEDGYRTEFHQVGGMSRRDYFAGQALIALLSSAGWVRDADDAFKKNGIAFKRGVAANAFALADEMVRESARLAALENEDAQS
jgi:hypothetical protein